MEISFNLQRLPLFTIKQSEEGQMYLNIESKGKSEQLSRIASELYTPEQILQAMVKQERRPRPEMETEFVSPRDSTEELLAQIYADELGLDRIGVEDNYFKLGGNSLTIVRIASRIQDTLGVELPMQAFFHSPTIAGLSESVRQFRSPQLEDDERDRILEMLDRLSDDEAEAMLEQSETGQTDVRSSFSQLIEARCGPAARHVEGGQTEVIVERYRAAGLESISLLDDKYWVYSWDSHKGGIIDSATMSLLRESGKFRKIDDLLWKFESWNGGATENAEAKIAELVDSGFLVSETGTISKLIKTGHRSSKLKISTLACVSCDRSTAAVRALSSYISNCQDFGKTPRFVVMDDSSDPNTRAEYRRKLLLLKEKLQTEIYYGGADEKRQFLGQLATRTALPADALEFALFGFAGEKLASSGRNRNALLLETIDEGVLSLDDDTICKIMAVSERGTDLRLLSGRENSGRDPSGIWSCHDPESSNKLFLPVDGDLLEIHEQFLGREVGDCVSSAYGKEKIDLEQTDACLPSRLKSYGGKIRLTLNGLIGDCGWGAPLPYLFLEGDSFHRLTSSESAYQKTLTCRELLRVTVNTVITDQTRNLMSTFFGFDNRVILPPFVPVGRGADYTFAMILSKCYRDNFFAHLPYALIHSPIEKRSFWPGEVQRSAAGIDLATLIAAFVDSFDPGSDHSGGEENLIRLGRFLLQFGMLPAPEFEEISRVAIYRHICGLIIELEEKLRQHSEAPDFWAKDVRQYLATLHGNLMRPEIVVPLDLRYGRKIDESFALMQRLIREYGSLLIHWPSIVQASREIKEQGARLVKAI
jgi:acyl carrier protein